MKSPFAHLTQQLRTFVSNNSFLKSWLSVPKTGLKFILILCGSVAIAGVSVYKWVQPPDLSYPNDFGNYISGFTTGTVSKKSTVSLVLNFDFPGIIHSGDTIKEELMEFEPSLNGVLVWKDQRTMEFTPGKELQSDKEYYCTFALGEILDTLPRKYREFAFKFKTFKQDFRIDYQGLHPIRENEPEWQQVGGTIQTNDFADSSGIVKMVKATQDEKALNIVWYIDSYYGGDHNYRFSIDSIRRGEKAGKVAVEVNGESIGVDRKDKRDFTVPAMGDFNVQEAKVEQYPTQSVVIRFSDPILNAQQLQGLLRIEGQPEPRLITENNTIRLFPVNRLKGNQKIIVSAGIQNVYGYKMIKGELLNVAFLPIKPGVRMVSQGVILPDAGKLYFPFEAVGMKAVDVSVYKLYENNILQFLQVNDVTGQEEIHRIGKKIITKRIELKYDTKEDLEFWHRYAIDLGSIIRTEPGAMYRVKLEIRKQDAIWECPAVAEESSDDEPSDMDEAEADNYYSHEPDFTEYQQPDDRKERYSWDYDYENNSYDDPCSNYYFSRGYGHNILASDLGIIVKRELNGKLHVIVNNLLTTQPVANASVYFYSYQQQIIAQGQTDAQGMIERMPSSKPFVIVVKSGTQRGYLKLDDEASLSLSNFDVDGRASEKGIKGFIYGERGVWRPGDSLFLNFILEDPLHSVPAKHPVIMELINPMGQVVTKLTKTESLNGFYDFRTATGTEAPTGNWMALVRVGNRTFTKNLKIETVKPNRLKLYLSFAGEMLKKSQQKDTAKLQVKWLHGAIARNLHADVEANVSQAFTRFDKYPDYSFEDVMKGFESSNLTLFDGNLDANGMAVFTTNLDAGKSAPGFLRANFFIRAFEEGGDFSTDRFSILYSPYASYAGIKINGSEGRRDVLETGKEQKIQLASVKEDGSPGSSKLQVKVYKLNWQWWWDRYDDDINYYLSRPGSFPVFDSLYTTTKGLATLNLRMNESDWGRYLVRVTDLQSGHSSGKIVYFESPWWQRGNTGGTQFASMLSFSSDKDGYKVGEKVKLTIPTAGKGKALISIESGERVLQKFWVNTSRGETHAEFTCTPEMSPNAYVFVTLLQPHGSVENDLPLRLYGIIPINVEDPGSHLEPLIAMADVLEPESIARITVKEKKGRSMTYTLAMVDEGLLDLTRFQTPDAWNEFYQKEALRVKTWDIYDWVIGAYGGKLNRILSIGGDGSGKNGKAAKANRFRPVVRFAGPFYLPAGSSKTHEFNLPQYIGSVRVMVVAGNNNGAYGKAEKTVAVKKPLMVLATLPRVVGPDEEIALPVNVFAMEEKIKNVSVQVEVNNLVAINGTAMQTIHFNLPGDEVVNFKLKVAQRIGIAKIKVTAKCGKEIAVQDFEVDVRPSNNEITHISRLRLDPGKEKTIDVSFTGLDGSHSLALESSVLPIDISKRMNYLIAYPHGCIEQTTSSAFPQLAMQNVLELSNVEKQKTTSHIKVALEKIALFQTNSGAFSYWPGMGDEHEWGSNYAGHFMLEAERMGYNLPVGMKNRWLTYQKKAAQNWSENSTARHEQLTQAYRLYTLALSGSPEIGSMNRLREMKNLDQASRWRLAAAYAQSGQTEVAKKLIKDQAVWVNSYTELSNTFGTAERDEAMILETLILLKDRVKADQVAERLVKKLNEDRWMSTQTTAYSLIALGKYMNVAASGNAMQFSYSFDKGSAVQRIQQKPAAKEVLLASGDRAPHTITFRNDGRSTIHLRLVTEFIPLQGDEPAVEKTIKMLWAFKDMKGAYMSPDKLKQGSDFIAEVTVINHGTKYLQQMTLNQIFPSGWEIRNMRMEETSIAPSDPITYQDYRDDRVYTYFDMQGSSKRTYRVVLNAAYRGRFYLPGIEAEAMYDREIYARMKGRWVEVVKDDKSVASK